MAADTYEDHVTEVEKQNGVGEFGFKSAEAIRVDGEDAFGKLADEWKKSEGRARLEGRTPVSLDRDRILYSDEFRRQDDKFHVIFFGVNRLKRTYTSHATKVVQVARSAATRLGLNSDLAEAIVLGTKVGGVPFIHVGKQEVAAWVRDKVKDQDEGPEFGTSAPTASSSGRQSSPTLFEVGANGELILPSWIDAIRQPGLREKVVKYLPWAAGSASTPAYASGQQSYWMLTLNPYTLKPSPSAYLAQTMYGIWRHSLVEPTAFTAEFQHRVNFGTKAHTLSQSNVTFEAMLVRYCDDITWTIENLSEASRVAAADAMVGETPFSQLVHMYRNELPDVVRTALYEEDAGALYTYFIDDLVQHSRSSMSAAGGIVRPSEKEPIVALSEVGKRTLDLMKEYLTEQIFKNERMNFRSETLAGITSTALDVLYRSYEGELTTRIERLARLGRWATTGELDDAKKHLKDKVHRIQVVVDVLASMSDREVFELVGLE